MIKWFQFPIFFNQLDHTKYVCASVYKIFFVEMKAWDFIEFLALWKC